VFERPLERAQVVSMSDKKSAPEPSMEEILPVVRVAIIVRYFPNK
jgi:hypothetical protein